MFQVLESLKSNRVRTVGYTQINSILEIKINHITKDLSPNYANRLTSTLGDNALSIADFILSLKTEINLSNNHIRNNIMVLTLLSRFHNDLKSFKEMTREDVIAFLDGVRKPESVDPLHRWIGTYNTYRTLLFKFQMVVSS
ncbi:MAG TPA: hypothetical protein VH500_01785 [Nitrososphaeraceae archaeon]|jgi:hypothetical protein